MTDARFRHSNDIGRKIDARLSEVLFCFALIVWLGASIFQTSLLRVMLPGLSEIKLIAIAVMIFAELLDQVDNKSPIEGILVVAALAALSYGTGGSTIAQAIIVIFFSRNYNFNKLIRISLATTIVCVGLIVASSFLGIVNDYTIYQGSRARRFLGFHYTTFLSHFFLSIVLMYMFLRRIECTYLEYAILIIIDCIIYIETDSRNSFMLALAVILICVILKIKHKETIKSPIIATLVTCSYLLFFAVSFIFVYGVDLNTPFGQIVDQIASGRLTLAHRCLDLYGVSLFGVDTPWNAGQWIDGYYYILGTHLSVDNAFFNIIIDNGVVVFVIIMVLLTLTCYLAAKSNDAYLMIVFLVYAFHCVMDPQIFRLEYCTFLLFVGRLWTPWGAQVFSRVRKERNQEKVPMNTYQAFPELSNMPNNLSRL